MKAIIVDDEYLALESMTRLLQRFEVQVAGAFQDPREALKQLEALDADVAFVDIEMPELNGLELVARLQAAQPSLQIVFVTAYEQYAIDAFELAAIDYLLKPIQLKRLETTIKRLSSKHADTTTPEPLQPMEQTICFFHHLSFQDAQGNPINIAWRTAKARELLAYLIHSGDKTPSKEELLDRIWPDADPDKSITHLHTTIYQIRQSMKTMGVPLSLQYKEGRYHVELGHPNRRRRMGESAEGRRRREGRQSRDALIDAKLSRRLSRDRGLHMVERGTGAASGAVARPSV